MSSVSTSTTPSTSSEKVIIARPLPKNGLSRHSHPIGINILGGARAGETQTANHQDFLRWLFTDDNISLVLPIWEKDVKAQKKREKFTKWLLTGDNLLFHWDEIVRKFRGSSTLQDVYDDIFEENACITYCLPKVITPFFTPKSRIWHRRECHGCNDWRVTKSQLITHLEVQLQDRHLIRFLLSFLPDEFNKRWYHRRSDALQAGRSLLQAPQPPVSASTSTTPPVVDLSEQAEDSDADSFVDMIDTLLD
jgi:hypothetical protein